MHTTSSTVRPGVPAIFLTLALLQPVFWAPVALADESSDESSADATVGERAGAYALTPFYFVAKVVYAGAGAVTGGLAWAVTGGSTKTAYAVWDPSLKGDYWVTPSHLKGERPLQFVGKTQERRFEEESPGTQDQPTAQPQSPQNQ